MNESRRQKLNAERARRVLAVEKRDKIREGHYRLDGKFVRIWIEFYPTERWLVEDASLPRGEGIEGTCRRLNAAEMKRLENWL
jgi:hypothetical protein